MTEVFAWYRIGSAAMRFPTFGPFCMAFSLIMHGEVTGVFQDPATGRLGSGITCQSGVLQGACGGVPSARQSRRYPERRAAGNFRSTAQGEPVLLGPAAR